MRVISGKYKGKVLKGFDILGTRPTMDRVKESLFGTIQEYINGSVCLDLFAGSGSLGIEALSCGAEICYFSDHNSEIVKILKENLKNVENSVVIQKDYVKTLDELKNIKFDIIFLDPPYKENLINKAIDIIIESNMLSNGGIIVCEYENEVILNHNLKEIKNKKYGNKNIKILKNI